MWWLEEGSRVYSTSFQNVRQARSWRIRPDLEGPGGGEGSGFKEFKAWDEYLEDGFQPLLTADSDAASVALDDGFDDREPEAASPSVSRP